MEPRNFDRERLAVWALIGATGVLCVVGSMAQFLDLPPDLKAGATCVLVAAFAAVFGFSLCVANVAAACAQILADHRGAKPWAFGVALATAVVTGAVSVIGVDLSWLVLTGRQQAMPPDQAVIAAGFCLGFVKVAMGFVIEACQQCEDATARGRDDVLAARDRRIETLERDNRALRAELDKKPSQDKPLPSPRVASKPAGRAMAKALLNEQPIGASKGAGTPPAVTVAPEQRDVTLAEIETACRKIMERRDDAGEAQKPSLRLVSSELNVVRSRVEKRLTQERLKLVDVVERIAA